MLTDFINTCSVVDVESTSPDPQTCEIIELAFCYAGIENIFTNHYKPSIPIPALSAEKHFISDHDVADCSSFAGVTEHGFFEVCDAVDYFVAHNAHYDKTAITQNCIEHELTMPHGLTEDWFCTLKLAKKIWRNDEALESYRLTFLWFHLGLNTVNQHKKLIPHQADSDIFMAGKLFEYLVLVLIDQGIVDPAQPIGPQVMKYQNAPYEITHWPFGKHAGVEMSKIPMSYFNWAVQNMDMFDEDSDQYDENLALSVATQFEQRG